MSDKQLIAALAIVQSSLYLAGCFIVGFWGGVPDAWRCALIAAGFSYLNLTFMMAEWRVAQMGCAIISLVFGVGAGLALLVGL